MNPIFKRQINSMFRSKKIFIGLGIYSFLLFALTLLILFAVISSGGTTNGFNPKYTLYIYCFMVAFQTIMITLVTPATASSSISGERERQTLDLMLLTKMTPSSIIIGNVLNSLFIVIMLICASMPVYAIIFYYGSASFFEFFLAIIYDIAYAFCLSSLAVLLSTVMKKTITATVLSYLVIWIAPSIITGVFIVLARLYFIDYSNIPYLLVCAIFACNPFTSFASLIGDFVGSTGFVSVSLIRLSQDLSENIFGFVKIWELNIIFNIIIGIILMKISSKQLNPIKETANKSIKK